MAHSTSLALVPQPLQPILPGSQAIKPNHPFLKRLANVRTGDPDAKNLLLVYGTWCDVYVDGEARVPTPFV